VYASSPIRQTVPVGTKVPSHVSISVKTTGGLVQLVCSIYHVDGAGGSTPPWRVLALWLVS